MQVFEKRAKSERSGKCDPIIVSPNPTSLDNSEVLIIDGEIIQRIIKGIYYKSKKELVSIITERFNQLQITNQRLMWR